MKTTSDIFKVTDSPVIVKETPAIQEVSMKAMEKYLRKCGFTPMAMEDQDVFSSAFKNSQEEVSGSSQEVAEPGTPYGK